MLDHIKSSIKDAAGEILNPACSWMDLATMSANCRCIFTYLNLSIYTVSGPFHSRITMKVYIFSVLFDIQEFSLIPQIENKKKP